jgi:hypothetical protein
MVNTSGRAVARFMLALACVLAATVSLGQPAQAAASHSATPAPSITWSAPTSSSVSVHKVRASSTMKSAGVAASAPTYYTVTANWHVSASVAGVTVITFHQRFVYTVRGSYCTPTACYAAAVTASKSCKGWYDGFTGIASLELSDSASVYSNGFAQCTTWTSGSLIYKGVAFVFNKEGAIEVNGYGVTDDWLVNV